MDKKKTNAPLSSYARFSGIAFQMVAIIAIGVFLGLKLDVYFDKEKLFTVICSLISVVFSIYFVVRKIIKHTK
ncbi:MAG: AtpZ/AtpI family protein [Flavobacteriaceae bacterium]|jgi:F0F1-type ATP synthase assembly protein I